jgi:hypothetical protein
MDKTGTCKEKFRKLEHGQGCCVENIYEWVQDLKTQ